LNDSKRIKNEKITTDFNLTTANAFRENSFNKSPLPKDLSNDLRDTLEAASILSVLRNDIESGKPPSREDILTLSTTEALPVSIRNKAVNILNVVRKSMESIHTQFKHKNTMMSIQEANEASLTAENTKITVKLQLSMKFSEISDSVGPFKSKLILTIVSALDTSVDHIEIARVAPLLSVDFNANSTKEMRFLRAKNKKYRRQDDNGSFGVDVTIVFKGKDAKNMTDAFISMLEDSSSSLRKKGPLSFVDIDSLKVTKGGEDEAETFASLDDLSASLESKASEASTSLKEIVKEEEENVSSMKMYERNVEDRLANIEENKGETTKVEQVQLVNKIKEIKGKTKDKRHFKVPLKNSSKNSIKEKERKSDEAMNSADTVPSSSTTTIQSRYKSISSNFKSISKHQQVHDDGKSQGYLHFDGGDYLDMGVKGYNSLSSGLLKSTMTVASWIRIHDVEEGKYSAVISSVAEVNQEKKGFLLGYGPSKTLPNNVIVWVFGIQTKDSIKKQKFHYVQSNVPVKNNRDNEHPKWVHIAGVMNNNVLKIYVNGNLSQKVLLPEPTSSSKNLIDFDTKESNFQLSPKLIFMTYAVNGIVPPPPCCLEADLSDTGIWSDALEPSEIMKMAETKQSTMAKATIKQPMVYLDFSSRFEKRHSMSHGASITFQVGTVGTLTATFVENDEASSIAIHTEKQSKVETMEEQGNGISLEERNNLLTDLSSEDLNKLYLISPSSSSSFQVNEAQIAFALATVLGGGDKTDIQMTIDKHEIMKGPLVSTSDIAQLMKHVLKSKRLNNKQLGSTLLALPKANSFARAANIFHTLLVGKVPTVIVESGEFQTVTSPKSETENLMKSNIERKANANANIKLLMESQKLAINNKKVLEDKNKKITDLKIDLKNKLDNVRYMQQKADAKMNQAVSLGKAIAKQYAQMNGWLLEHGFSALKNEELEQNTKNGTKTANAEKGAEFKSRVQETATLAISRIAAQSLHEAKDRRSKLCNSNSSNGVDISLCYKATRDAEEAEDVYNRAQIKLSTVSDDLRKAVEKQNGKFAAYLNSTASTAADIKEQLQNLIHDEAMSHMLSSKAEKEGNRELAQLYNAQALDFKKRMESLALQHVSLLSHGITSKGKSPLLSEAEGKINEIENTNDPQWLKFAAHNMKLEISSQLMSSEIEVKTAEQAVEKCQRERILTMDNDCTVLLGHLNRAKAHLFVVRTKLYSINGLFAKGISRITDREIRLEKEKESIIDASSRMNDQKLEAQENLNSSNVEVENLKKELQQEKLSRMYANGAIEQMANEINGTESAYVRAAFRFRSKISPDSKEFDTKVKDALASAFNTTESNIIIDIIKNLQGMTIKSVAGLRGRRRRLLTAVKRSSDVSNEVSIYIRVLSEEELIDNVERTIRLAATNGDLERIMLEDGVGSSVMLIGNIQSVVRSSVVQKNPEI
jgi:hypothetical protein